MAAPSGSEREDAPAARRAGARRAHILEVISGSSRGLGIKALADATGLHENTVRFHLDRLLEDGHIERCPGTSSGPGRPALTFVARQGQRGRDNYELIAQVLTGSLHASAADPGAAARQAGRDWGRSRVAGVTGGASDSGTGARSSGAALEALADVLHETGFAPEVVPHEAGATVRVHRCPFLSLSREDQVVPCGVHLGLMEGALEALHPSVQVARLEPFVTPSLCVAQLTECAEA